MSAIDFSAPLERLKALPRRIIAVIGAVLVTIVFLHFATRTGSTSYRYSKDAIRKNSWKRTSDVDIVVAHYDEDVNILKESLSQVVKRLSYGTSHRITIYSKGARDTEGLQELLELADEVVSLPNVGREGETYLSHIVRHYDNAETDFGTHTIFMQPHIAWDWVFLPRLENCFGRNTGFLSFGPHVNQTCGKDSAGLEFRRMADIYSAFRADLCPPEPVLATWAGQFVVSRRRILDNKLKAYANLRNIFHAPEGHWIWKEGWGNNEPSNPTLGHALERTWPVIFDCTDIKIAETCHDGHGSTCQCYD